MGFLDRFKDIPIDEPTTTPEDNGKIEFNDADARQVGSTPLGEPSTKDEPTPQKRHGTRRFFAWFFLILGIVLGAAFYLRYLNPYVTDATVRGYVNRIERRGIIFKTYELEMVSDAALDDTRKVYTRDCSFSVDNDSIVAKLQKLQGTGERVVVTYETFYGTLPWRGASNSVVTAVRAGS